MRKLIAIFCGLSLLGLTGCIDMLEEIYLNQDGSGTYTMNFDMSGMFSDPMMKGMMNELMQSEDGLKLKNGMGEEVDTLITFGNMPADLRAKLEKPDFWKKVTMHMVMSEKQNKMFTELKLNFDSMDDISYMFKNMDQLSAGTEAGNGMMGGGFSEMMPAGALFELNKRVLTRLPSPKPKDGMDGEEMGMVKMFLGAAEYKTVYHLPGKVKKTTIPDAEINGNTVTVNSSFIDILDGKAKTEGEIRFKKK